MPDLSQWTLRFLDYEPIDEALDDRMLRIAGDADKIPPEAMQLDREAGVLTIDCKKIPAWNDGAKQRLRGVRVGRFVVRPPWVDAATAPGEIDIEIDPQGAFGSALHETTQLCLQAIERHLPAGARVLEIGTGSGVLSIAAVHCGAAEVCAVDIDPSAVQSARANVTRNGVDDRVKVDNVQEPPWCEGPVDAVIANITFDTLTRLLEPIGAVVRRGGLLIVSGFSARFWDQFVSKTHDSGFEALDRLNKGPWSALIATRRTS